MRHPLLFTLLLALGTPIASARPNVVLFLVDDMGWMDSSVYGSEYYESPNMEALAKQAMKFTDAYAVPLCSPTRATILSGQHSSRHGVTSASGHQPPAEPDAPRYAEKASPNKPLIYADSKNYLDPGLITLAEVLKDAGYRTGHFGKWHLGLPKEYRPEYHGFEVAWHAAPDPGPPSYFSPYGVVPEGKAGGQNRVGTITDGPEGEYITDRLTDEAIAFIEAHQDEPFFLNLWQFGVHGPWGHKEEYTAEFAKKTDPRGFQKNPIMASMLKSVDESLGRVMAKLDELGLAENTLFIFYSDNGGNEHSNTPDDRKFRSLKPDHPKYAMLEDWIKWAGPEAPTNNAPLREGKGRIYEGGQRVPLLIRWPGHVEPGTTSDAIVGAIDLYPTILDAVGLEIPDGHIVDGLSILPVLEQTGEWERDTYFTWFPHLIPAVSVRQGDWKLIRRFEFHPLYPDLLELYNLKEDIGETNNLADAMPDKVEALNALIDGFIEETGALMPKPNPAYQPAAAQRKVTSTAGLVPKACELKLIDGAARVTGTGRRPFLGTAQVKGKGSLTLNLTLRAPQGGTGMLQWRTAGQDGFPETGQMQEFQVPANPDWQDLQINFPVVGQTQTVRLFVPAEANSVDLRTIAFSNADGSIKQWDFTDAKAE